MISSSVDTLDMYSSSESMPVVTGVGGAAKPAEATSLFGGESSLWSGLTVASAAFRFLVGGMVAAQERTREPGGHGPSTVGRRQTEWGPETSEVGVWGCRCPEKRQRARMNRWKVALQLGSEGSPREGVFRDKEALLLPRSGSVETLLRRRRVAAELMTKARR